MAGRSGPQAAWQSTDDGAIPFSKRCQNGIITLTTCPIRLLILISLIALVFLGNSLCCFLFPKDFEALRLVGLRLVALGFSSVSSPRSSSTVATAGIVGGFKFLIVSWYLTGSWGQQYLGDSVGSTCDVLFCSIFALPGNRYVLFWVWTAPRVNTVPNLVATGRFKLRDRVGSSSIPNITSNVTSAITHLEWTKDQQMVFGVVERVF